MLVAVSTLAVALSVIQLALQTRRIFATTAAGVAPATWVLWALSTVSWGTWGWVEGVPASVVTNLPAAFLALAGTARLLGSDTRGRLQLSVVVLGAVGCAALTAHQPGPVGATLALVGPVSVAPQLLRVILGGDLAGLSTAGWLLAAVSQVAWIGVGVAEGAPAIWAGSSAALAQTLVIVAVLLGRPHRGRRRREAAPAPS